MEQWIRMEKGERGVIVEDQMLMCILEVRGKGSAEFLAKSENGWEVRCWEWWLIVCRYFILFFIGFLFDLVCSFVIFAIGNKLIKKKACMSS